MRTTQTAAGRTRAPRMLAPVAMALAVVVALCSAAAGSAGATVPTLRHGTPPAPTAVPGEIVVGFRGTAGATDRIHARAQARVSIRRGLLVPHAQLVHVDSGQTVGAAIRALKARPDVRYAEPNYIYRATSTAPNDPGFSSEWGLQDISALPAWEVSMGAGTIVAVVDSGVASDHPDLAPNIWTNAREQGGAANVDDDGNGKPDDINGWDFVDNDNTPWDYNDHGTHVAGTIAAVANNNVGIAGVAPHATIMPVRALDATGSGYDSDIANAMTYAADNGARVVNLSLGGPDPSAVMEEAISTHPDTLFVVAAGNETANNDDPAGTGTYPCDDPEVNVICVAATDTSGELAKFSNFGTRSVDLGAPGVGIYSTRPHYDFSDDFESGLGQWTVENGPWGTASEGGTTWLMDSPGAPYSNNADWSIRTTTAVDVGARGGCVFKFAYGGALEQGHDWLYLQSSPDGTTWTDLGQYGSTVDGPYIDIEDEAVMLGAPGARYYRFRLVSDTATTSAGVYIDDVAIGCPGGTYNAGDYQFMEGTSMATPYVAGAAAVLLGVDPAASIDQVRNALLACGDTASSLEGTTVTGRRLDLLASVRALTGSSTPTAVTGAATNVATTSATLGGQVDPQCVNATYHFDVRREDGAYGALRTPDASAGSGRGAVAASGTVAGLQPSTTYTYRLVAVDDDGKTATGGEASFTTTAAPTVPVATVPPPSTTATTTTTTTTTPTPAPKPKAHVRCRAHGRRVRCAVSYPGLRRASFTVRLGRRVYARGSTRRARSGRYVRLHSVRRPRHGRRYAVVVRFVDVHRRVRLVTAKVRL